MTDNFKIFRNEMNFLKFDYIISNILMNKCISVQDFNILTVIGQGSYAKVVLVKMKSTQKVYALKILKKKLIQKKKYQEQVMIERNVLIQTDHPFIIKMFYSFQSISKLFFVLEFCPGGQLFTLLSKKRKFTEQQTKFYAAQIILGLQYLHSKDIVYSDLKPQNILIDETGYIRLADFGLAQKKPHCTDVSNYLGTPQYLAPEILYKQSYGKSIDWWCLGSIIYQMITGSPPFTAKTRQQLFDKIKFSNPNIPSFISSKLRSLLQGLLQKKANNRLGNKGANSIKKHIWFQKFKWDSILRKQIKAPFKPLLKSEVDVSNFESEFTQIEVESLIEDVQESCEKLQYSNFYYNKNSQESVLRELRPEQQQNIVFKMNQESE